MRSGVPDFVVTDPLQFEHFDVARDNLFLFVRRCGTCARASQSDVKCRYRLTTGNGAMTVVPVMHHAPESGKDWYCAELPHASDDVDTGRPVARRICLGDDWCGLEQSSHGAR